MLITIGEKDYDLSTKLKVAMTLEDKFKLPLTQLFAKIESADIKELENILAVSAGKQGDPVFKDAVLENLDYLDLQINVQKLLANLMFHGTPEQIEKKLEKFPAPEEGKNAIRELLGIPIPVPAAPSTGPESQESDTQ